MDEMFWQERWQAGQIGFHAPEVNPHLVRHAARLCGSAGPTRVLLPLCGKSVDLTWLASQGHEVVGVEFVEQAAAAHFHEQGVTPETTHIGPWRALRHRGVTIVLANFFELNVDDGPLGTFPAVFDRAALIAVEPARRDDYMARIHALSAADARLLMVALDHDMPTGPPFSVPRDALAILARGRFALDAVDDTDVLAAEPRFRDRGATRMRDQVWLGRRL
jgi:thiopurine S-methyltransferase